ncbi:MAG: CoA-binding protein [Hydrogenothermaceae bacterium]|nr:CoA-binding protein [Hydrogenothermaceae bacterium]
MPVITSKEKIREILKNSKNVAVIGISPDPSRPSYFVSEVVKRYGFNIFFVNPKYEGQIILGEPVYKSILDIPVDIDIVDLFRRPADVIYTAQDAVKKGFKTFWFQPGTLNLEVSKDLSQKGYNVVENYCLKVACMELL